MPSGRPEGIGGDRAEAQLSRLAELARDLAAEPIAAAARSLAERVSEERFYVACIGQFKRGKSTLLNALIGHSILPTGVVPVTAVPSVIRYGDSLAARVRAENAEWKEIPVSAVEEYVTEEKNPENSKHVAGLEIFVPNLLLRTGLCLVDTPGLGSVFAGNTAATQAFLPHIDAAIIVLGTDPPIAGEELDLVEKAAKQVRDFVVVLNKVDKASDAERQEAKSFARKVLERRLARQVGEIYEISAGERLADRGPQRDWEKLTAALESLVKTSGHSLVRMAGERGLRRLGEELLAAIEEESQALSRPIEESEGRIERLRQTIAEAEGSLRDIGPLFTAEQYRLSDLFLARRKTFLAKASPRAHAEFTKALRHLRRSFGPKFRRDAMHAAQAVAETNVLPWLEIEQAHAQEEYVKVELRFATIGSDFLKKLSESGISELARIPGTLDDREGFRVASRFSFERLLPVALPASPLRYLADISLGVAGASSTIERQAREFLDHLLGMNCTRVQSDVANRVEESRKQTEAEIRKLLREVRRVAERALDHARAARAEGASAVEARLSRLDAMEREVRLLAGNARTPSVSDPET